MDAQATGERARGIRRSKDFQRVYKACESCRKKKIRCVLDDSKGPAGPPCVRCRREMRECVISTERSTRKRDTRERRAASHRDEAMDDDEPTMDSVTYLGEAETAPATLPATITGTAPTQASQGDDGLTDTVMRTVVSSGNDALHLLFRAAEQRDAQSPQYQTPGSHRSRAGGDFATPGRVSTVPTETVQLSQAAPSVLEVWSALRFTRMGWFTAEEAVTYMDLFFKNLAPLSPVCQDLDSSHENHFWLVTQEPILCCTILMISSRYHILPGAGGSSRGMLIHQRLWEHCQYLVMRVVFGQEKRSKAKTRTMGAIEALLMIIEWHPKAIHFPPPSDGWDADILLSAGDRRDNPLGNRAETDDPGERWLRVVVTPTKMSDRMSWMLLGCAQSLATELGLCDANGIENSSGTSATPDTQMARRSQICKLLLIFGEQLSARLGCVSMASSSLSRIPSVRSDKGQHSVFMTAWVEITHLFRTISDALFPSTVGTRQMLSSYKYVTVIAHFQQQLLSWKAAHLHESRFKPISFQEISIEYNHVRILMNSLGMQAVVDRVLGERGGDSGIGQSHSGIQASLTASDYQFIQEVIDGSCQILQSAITLSDSGSLRFCPVRVFVRVIGASIFLLKALGLGAHTANLQASLAILDQSILALHRSSPDDMHLASQFASLLELHIARFRQLLIPSSAPPGISTLDFGFDWNGSGGSAQGMGGAAPLSSDFQTSADDWLSLPFDPSMAPFGAGESYEMPEIEDGTWDFLWNLPG